MNKYLLKSMLYLPLILFINQAISAPKLFMKRYPPQLSKDMFGRDNQYSDMPLLTRDMEMLTMLYL